ncbi:hypothetical protein E2C01_058101 [Portunus trituberculatus]|uniref:Uncharacterized protein n=1 Tax=Portunus trituberculatus TaxID=210409 RepID=A0A5B7GYQ8_PORTR|nr:hypothetical protein [Portunus trituberculatus]
MKGVIANTKTPTRAGPQYRNTTAPQQYRAPCTCRLLVGEMAAAAAAGTLSSRTAELSGNDGFLPELPFLSSLAFQITEIELFTWKSKEIDSQVVSMLHYISKTEEKRRDGPGRRPFHEMPS